MFTRRLHWFSDVIFARRRLPRRLQASKSRPKAAFSKNNPHAYCAIITFAITPVEVLTST